MAYFKEIVTKAVIGKGKKSTTEKFTIKPNEQPSTVLGCWIINHKFQGNTSNGDIYVNGSYDVNVWYSYESDTKTNVASANFTYHDKMNVPTIKENLTNDTEVIVTNLVEPNVVDVTIDNENIVFNIRKEMGIEVVGDTKIRVNVEDNIDDYTEILDEDVDSNILKEIDNEVKEEYLEEE